MNKKEVRAVVGTVCTGLYENKKRFVFIPSAPSAKIISKSALHAFVYILSVEVESANFDFELSQELVFDEDERMLVQLYLLDSDVVVDFLTEFEAAKTFQDKQR